MLHISATKHCDCGSMHQFSSVRFRRMQAPKEISALQLQRGTSGSPHEFHLAEDGEAQVFTLGSTQLLSGSGGQRLRPISDPVEDTLQCSGPSALFFPSVFLEQVSLPSASHLLTPCLSWLFFQSQFCPNALGSLPSPSISSKFTIPVRLSSFPHCIPVSVPSPPGPCPRLPPPVFLEEVLALP